MGGITPSRAAASLLGSDVMPVEVGSGSPRRALGEGRQFEVTTPGEALGTSQKLECKWCSKTIRSNQVQAAKQCSCCSLIMHKTCWKAILEQIAYSRGYVKDWKGDVNHAAIQETLETLQPVFTEGRLDVVAGFVSKHAVACHSCMNAAQTPCTSKNLFEHEDETEGDDSDSPLGEEDDATFTTALTSDGQSMLGGQGPRLPELEAHMQVVRELAEIEKAQNSAPPAYPGLDEEGQGVQLQRSDKKEMAKWALEATNWKGGLTPWQAAILGEYVQSVEGESGIALRSTVQAMGWDGLVLPAEGAMLEWHLLEAQLELLAGSEQGQQQWLIAEQDGKTCVDRTDKIPTGVMPPRAPNLRASCHLLL